LVLSVFADDIISLFTYEIDNWVTVQEESDTFRQLIRNLALPTSLQREDWRSFVGVRSTIICTICKSALNSFIQFRRKNASEEQIRHKAIKLCTLLNMQTDQVCDGIITINLVSKSNCVCVMQIKH